MKNHELLLVTAFLIITLALVSTQMSGFHIVVTYKEAEFAPSGVITITHSGWPAAWLVDYSYDTYAPLRLDGFIMDMVFYAVIYSVIAALIFGIYHFRVGPKIEQNSQC